MTNYNLILLHGIARNSRHMRKLANHLAGQGYRPLNLDYPSTRYSLDELADWIWERVEPQLDRAQPVHCVGYSMGGLLLRVILARYRPVMMGRVVQLAPPNQGSEVADFWQNIWLYRWIYGVAGQQLVTDQQSIAHLFQPIDYELGVLAGNRSFDPISSRLILGADDGKVSVESTKVGGMADHCVLPACHTFFPSHPQVLRQTAHFLAHGAFE